MKTRRSFLVQSAAVTTGFLGLSRFLGHGAEAADAFSYGELVPDPEGILDLPPGFQYRILSRTGDRMSDGYKVPGKPDGMAAFDVGSGRIALVRNHEIGHSGHKHGPFEDNTKLPDGFDPAMIYDGGRHEAQPFVGGTSTLVYDAKSGEVVEQFLSLVGTDRNCAGGPTPWGSWITCEEPGDLTSQWGSFHGYCFEVPAKASPELTKPIPLRGLGRFRHEAVAVDPRTGIVYLTEDQGDGAIYRFVPSTPGDLAAPGKLQALKLKESGLTDSRNSPGGDQSFPIGERLATEWVDLEDVESPNDDLRRQALSKGALMFTRGEGMWYGSPDAVGERSIYWACTDGGAKSNGQIFRYFPGESETEPGHVELYLEPNDNSLLKNGDNITIAPSGHLYICEDNSGPNHIRAVTKEGSLYTFARQPAPQEEQSEFAGACFSPDGKILFVNIQSPGITFAITGPFA